jgi:hypothetical protein
MSPILSGLNFSAMLVGWQMLMASTIFSKELMILFYKVSKQQILYPTFIPYFAEWLNKTF